MVIYMVIIKKKIEYFRIKINSDFSKDFQFCFSFVIILLIFPLVTWILYIKNKYSKILFLNGEIFYIFIYLFI